MKTDRLLHKFREQPPAFRGNLHENSELHAGFRYEKLGRLRHLRNAIVHQGGWVNSENIRRLQRFGYREGQYIDLDATEFASTRKLVYETGRDSR